MSNGSTNRASGVQEEQYRRYDVGVTPKADLKTFEKLVAAVYPHSRARSPTVSAVFRNR